MGNRQLRELPALEKMISHKKTQLNLDKYEWRRVTDPSFQQYRIDFEYSLMGYDKDAGRLDMLLRYPPGKGHCRRHRHLAATSTLVLEGDQFLTEIQCDGSKKQIHRKQGEYAISKGDALPHMEHGGDHGGTVMLSLCATNGLLFEYFGEHPNDCWTVSIDQFIDSWNMGEIYGARK